MFPARKKTLNKELLWTMAQQNLSVLKVILASNNNKTKQNKQTNNKNNKTHPPKQPWMNVFFLACKDPICICINCDLCSACVFWIPCFMFVFCTGVSIFMLRLHWNYSVNRTGHMTPDTGGSRIHFGWCSLSSGYGILELTGRNRDTALL